MAENNALILFAPMPCPNAGRKRSWPRIMRSLLIKSNGEKNGGSGTRVAETGDFGQKIGNFFEAKRI